PDGQHIAYAALNSEGTATLWVRSLRSVVPRQLPATDVSGATPPFWSADSRYIGFVGGGKLKKIDVSGGPPETLCDVGFGAVRGGTWNRDGIILFASSDDRGSVITRVSALGGGVTPVTAHRSSRDRHAAPFFLPDGRHFLYSGGNLEDDRRSIYVGSLDSKSTTRLMTSDTAAIYSD